MSCIRVIENPKHGDSIESFEAPYPSRMHIVGDSYEEQDLRSSSYGYLISGSAELKTDTISAVLKRGSYFCVPGRYEICAHGLIAIVQRYGYLGQYVIGMTESVGRLSYIDGCSDSLLVYPPRKGDPCFNFLHFPRGISQTQHTHPTIRFGIVAKGKGKAFRVPTAGSSGWEKDLTEGCVFLLPSQEQHSFRTTETDTEMDVVAFHPDSDWGPTDAAHPMRNRTYIGNDRTGQTGV